MRTISFFLAFALLTACDKERCKDGVICDDYYAMVDVAVKDENGTVVSLDSARVTRGELSYKPEIQELAGAGRSYTIATDSDRDSISFDGTEFNFYGWSGGELVVNEVFLIGRDCCHILKYEGPDEVILN